MKTRTTILICLLWSGAMAAPAEHVLHVAVNGSPDGNGSVQNPFANLQQAVIAARGIRAREAPDPVGIDIRLGEGLYTIDRAVTLGQADSGSETQPLRIGPAPGARVTLFGGSVLKPGWFRPVDDEESLARLIDPAARSKILVADLREHVIQDLGELTSHGWAAEPKARVPPAFLAIGGRRMTLARWPNERVESPFMTYRHYLPEKRPLRGYEKTVQAIIDRVRLPGEVTYTDVLDPGERLIETRKRGQPGRGGTVRVAFDRMKHWHDIGNVFLDGVLSSTWEWTYNRLAAADPEARTITFARAELHGVGQGESVRLPHFHFQNIPEELDTAGEYFIDRERGLLTLIPPAEFANSPIVLATLAEPMIAIDGAAHVELHGLTLDSGRSLGIDVKNARSIRIDHCEIANFAAGGVTVRGRNVRVTNCRIRGLGAHGVHLQGGDFGTLQPAGNEVVNCRIHDFGWDQKSQLPGVMIDGVGHRIAHCDITNGPHFGIRIRHANDVIVEYNEIHHLPNYHKFDGGALYVYTGPRAESRGIVIRHNYFHDIPTIGVYPDNFSWGVHIHGNVFANVGQVANRAAVSVNGGGECRTFNNVMINCPAMYQQGARPKEQRWFRHWTKTQARFGNGKIEETPYRKYDDLKVWLAKKEPDEFFRPTSHVYHNVLHVPDTRRSERGIRDHSRTLDARNNWVTLQDPGFVDADAGDFRLRKDAPLFTRIPEFEPIQFDRMGLLAESVGP